MSIINRDKNITEQKEWVNWANASYGLSGLVQSGQTLMIGGPMPFPGRLQSGVISALGISTGMQLALAVQRFVPGAGYTSIGMGISNLVVTASSTSGPLGFSGLAAQNSTLMTFLGGDIFVLTTSGAGAVSSLAVQLTVVKTQEIVSHNAINV